MNLETKNIINVITKAVTNKSECCLNEHLHNYEFILNIKSRESNSFYYKCSRCNEIIVNSKSSIVGNIN